MKQSPSRTKFKKSHKPANNYLLRSTYKNFFAKRGNFCLKSLKAGKVTYKQLEAGRKAVRRSIRGYGSVAIKPFTNKSLTKRSVGVRMGKGKGAHHVWVDTIAAGQVIYEIVCSNPDMAFKGLRNAATKMPFPCLYNKLIY